jgi:hypothetical protein
MTTSVFLSPPSFCLELRQFLALLLSGLIWNPLPGYSQEVQPPPQARNVHWESSRGVPSATLCNINNLAGWYESDGRQETWSAHANGGLFYPRGTAIAIFSAGLVWAGKFHDGLSPELRIGGQQWTATTTPGAILGLRTGITEDPSSPGVRIWRVRGDYATADLFLDASEFYGIPTPTQDQIDSLRTQYFLDWSEWPWEKGAPFYDDGYLDAAGMLAGAGNGSLDRGEDLNRNGILDQGEDANGNGALDAESPGLADANQVLWTVCNDIDPGPPGACEGSGLEQQTTVWAYDRTDALAEAIFKRHRLIYKGIETTPVDAFIDSLYLGQWTDADLGIFGDDFAGCDTLLSVGYVYNSDSVDAQYLQFGEIPPRLDSGG